jgi:hypothetical protein
MVIHQLVQFSTIRGIAISLFSTSPTAPSRAIVRCARQGSATNETWSRHPCLPPDPADVREEGNSHIPAWRFLMVFFLAVAAATVGECNAREAPFDVVVITGTPAPDGNGVFENFPYYTINESGQIFFAASLTETTGGTEDNQGLYRIDAGGITQLLRTGQELPGGIRVVDMRSGRSETPSVAVNETGEAAIEVIIAGPGIPEEGLSAAFLTDGASVKEIGRSSTARSPACRGRCSSDLTLEGISSTSPARVVFSDPTLLQPLIPNLETLYWGDGDATVKVAEPGDPAPDGDGEILWTQLVPRSPAGVNDSGQIAFGVTYKDMSQPGVSQAILLGDGIEPLAQVIREGDRVPGNDGYFLNLDSMRLNQNGVVAFDANFDLDGNTIRWDGNGIYLADSGSISEVVRTGRPTPNDGFYFETERYAFNDAGQIAFSAQLSETDGAGSINPQYVPGWSDDEAVFIADTDGSIREIAREGDVAPDGEGTLTNLLSTTKINDVGQVAFLARIQPDDPGFGPEFLYVPFSTLFFNDPEHGLIDVVSHRDVLLGSYLTRGTGGPRASFSGGLSIRGMNNRGDLLFRFVLSDRRAGLGLWNLDTHPPVDPGARNEARAVLLGVNDAIVGEHVAVTEEVYADRRHHSLHLTLTEIDGHGESYLRGEKTIRLNEAALLEPDGPHGRVLLAVDWQTEPILYTHNTVIACVEIVGQSKGSLYSNGEPDCSALYPQEMKESERTTAEAAFFAQDQTIGSEYIAVKREWFDNPGRITLAVNLEEDPVFGPVKDLGSQSIPLAETRVVDDDGPDGRILVAIDWETAPVAHDSELNSCIQVFQRSGSMDTPVSNVECRSVYPDPAAEAGSVTSPRAAFLSYEREFVGEHIAVRKKYFNRQERYSLSLSLGKQVDDDTVIPIGEQTIRISEATLISAAGPDGRPVVEVPWITETLEEDSLLHSCVKVIEHGDSGDKTVSGPECRTLHAQYIRIGMVTWPSSLFLGASGGISGEDVRVRREFFEQPERHSLALSLVEIKIPSGEEITLGEQTHKIAEFPGIQYERLGSGVSVVAWDTDDIDYFGSEIRACVQVFRHLDGGGELPVSAHSCRLLEPIF